MTQPAEIGATHLVVWGEFEYAYAFDRPTLELALADVDEQARYDIVCTHETCPRRPLGWIDSIGPKTWAGTDTTTLTGRVFIPQGNKVTAARLRLKAIREDGDKVAYWLATSH